MSLLDPKLYLPQDDPKPDKRTRQLETARGKHRYTYDKPNIRGLAMLEELHLEDFPHPDWIAQTAAAAAAISLNSAKIAGDEERSDPLHPSHGTLAERLKTAAGDAPAAALEHVYYAVQSGGSSGVATELAEYARMYQHFRVPDVASECMLDDAFARARLAGANPAWLRRVPPDEGLPDDLSVTADLYRSVVRDDTLEAARAEGRLFLSAYRQLLDAEPGSHPLPAPVEGKYADDPAAWDAAYQEREAAYAQTGKRKTAVAPLALFSAVDGTLRPVAIQLFPQGARGQTWPVFTPHDGIAWVEARAAVQCADFNVHETMSHLGLTHLVQEAFALAMHNCLAPRHPVHRLLLPHFEGTFAINTGADSALVNTHGGVDKILNSTIGSSIKLTADAVRGLDWNASILPRDLEARGTDDTDVLPHYPFRDDGLLVWNAIRSWTKACVRAWYGSDADVVADPELQAFVRQVGQFQVDDGSGNLVGGGIRGVGEDDGVQTRAYLITMLAQIIWTSSGQHAAVNFPQRDLMSYVPNMPGALFGALPSGPSGTSPEALLELLPDVDLARAQQALTMLLGGVHHTRLGQYAPNWFGAELKDDLSTFQSALRGIDSLVEDRNSTRPRYEFLKPSCIPQSINI